MANTTKIEWTDSTWNPITGCTLVDAGCNNCYAATLAATRLKHHPSRAGLARQNAAGIAKFTGEVRLNEQWLDQPLRWRKPRMIFVCAHGDLFHPNVPDEWIDRVFAVMALCHQHTFQVLTKRPERALEYLSAQRSINEVGERIRLTALHGRNDWRGFSSVGEAFSAHTGLEMHNPWWPLPNVWLGTSVSDQQSANERIPHLLKTPAAVRFLSAEPLLGPVGLSDVCTGHHFENYLAGTRWHDGPGLSTHEYGLPKLDWVIVGGESGRNARPMHPDWARSLRDQCAEAGVPFFFKQWGEWLPAEFHAAPDVYFQNGDWMDANTLPDIDVENDWCEDWFNDEFEGHCLFKRTGKRAAGRLLDGREWNEVPG